MKTFVMLHLLLLPFTAAFALSTEPDGGRRSLLKGGTAVLTSAFWTGPIVTKSLAVVETIQASGVQTNAHLGQLGFDALQVIPDASVSLSPRLQYLSPDFLWQKLMSSTAKGGALWLGEHHNAKSDHLFQAYLLRKLHQLRRNEGPLAVGMEQVQVQFQPVLDEYSSGRISSSDMRRLVEWDRRWSWPFEIYQPVLETAQSLSIPLVALNVNSEDLALVERNGLPGLSRDQLRQYIPDAIGFASFAKMKDFSAYVDYVIRPSYDIHQALGLLRRTISGESLAQDMPFVNFLSLHILWDEAMASNAYRWSSMNPGGLLVGIVGADHVKFRNGIPGRYTRLAADKQDCVSVVMNPTLIDSRPSGSIANANRSDSTSDLEQLTLQLLYLKDGVNALSPERSLASSTGGVLPIADFIVITK